MGKRAQRAVYRAVEKRGYRAGFNVEQFFARQIMKLTEELAELALLVDWDEDTRGFLTLLIYAGKEARRCFDMDMPRRQRLLHHVNLEDAKKEIADLQVVVYCLAEALSERMGEPVDAERLALQKSRADVPRGKRAGNHRDCRKEG